MKGKKGKGHVPYQPYLLRSLKWQPGYQTRYRRGELRGHVFLCLYVLPKWVYLQLERGWCATVRARGAGITNVGCNVTFG